MHRPLPEPTRTRSIRRLYRVVSAAELEQIKLSEKFETAPGSFEGKHLWTNLGAAREWALENYPDSAIVVATYGALSVKKFANLGKVDKQKTALFADESQMNESLLRLREVRLERRK